MISVLSSGIAYVSIRAVAAVLLMYIAVIVFAVFLTAAIVINLVIKTNEFGLDEAHLDDYSDGIRYEAMHNRLDVYSMDSFMRIYRYDPYSEDTEEQPPVPSILQDDPNDIYGELEEVDGPLFKPPDPQ